MSNYHFKRLSVLALTECVSFTNSLSQFILELLFYFTKPLDYYQCQKNNHCLLISCPMLQLAPTG